MDSLLGRVAAKPILFWLSLIWSCHGLSTVKNPSVPYLSDTSDRASLRPTINANTSTSSTFIACTDADTGADEEEANPFSPGRPPWTDYLVPRTVQVRRQAGSILPWQKYHATGYQREQQQLSFEEGINQQDDVHDNIGPTSNSTTTLLSHSSATLWKIYESLNPEQRQQFEQKVAAESRASRPLCLNRHLHVVYGDSHIFAVIKPSGILSVPGPRRNPSLATLVYDLVQPGRNHNDNVNEKNNPDSALLLDHMDQTVVHRLDMDTSGIMVFALSQPALSQLHDDFRHRRVRKQYQALLVGHLPVAEIDIELSLERDPLHPPFMRIAQPRRPDNRPKPSSTIPQFASFEKKLDQAAKKSCTDVTVLAWEYLQNMDGTRLPVTRVQLIPHTGRTHQLRVHCAAIGYPIVGDDIYGIHGEGDAGGNSGSLQLTLQDQVYEYWRQKQSSGVHAPRLCLHAHQLCFCHPITGAPIVLEADPPF